MKLSKDRRGDYCVIFHDDDRTVTVSKVITVGDQTIETTNEVIPIENAKRFVNSEGGIVFVYGNVSHGTMIEFNNLKNLRRSVALQRMFDYDRGKNIDIATICVWIAVFLLIIFK